MEFADYESHERLFEELLDVGLKGRLLKNVEEKSNSVCENAGEKKGLEDRKFNENCINPCPGFFLETSQRHLKNGLKTLCLSNLLFSLLTPS